MGIFSRSVMMLAFWVFISSAYAAPPDAKPWFTAQSWTLDNGLRVIIIPNHRAPLVRVHVWVKTGGANDLAGKSGTAHYLEHLMFRGNDDYKDGEYSARVKSWGGQENAFTSLDVTSYFATVPSDKLQDLLMMEASRMASLKPEPATAVTEHKVIMQERAQTIDSDPPRAFAETLSAALYNDHVYGRPIIGTPDEIKILTLEDARAFHDRWYGPDNTIVVISGDVKEHAARRYIEKAFGPLHPVNPPPATYDAQTVAGLKTDKTIQKCDARVQQPLLGLSWSLPAQGYSAQDALTAQVLAAILDGDATSPLYKELVENKKRVTAFRVYADHSLKNSGQFGIDYWPRADSDLTYAQLETDIKTTLQTVISDIKPDDVTRAIAQLRLGYELASDEPLSLGYAIGYQVAMGQSLDDIQQEPLWLDAVTAPAIKNFAARYLFAPARGALHSRLLPEGDRACAG